MYKRNWWASIDDREMLGTFVCLYANSNNAMLYAKSIEESEKVGVDHVESSVGLGLFDNARDVDLTGTYWKPLAIVKREGGGDTYPEKSSQY